MATTCRDLLESYISLHNAGVVSGDFEAMLGLFCDDAEMRFSGIPIGPFNGLEQIARAFAHDPPADSLELLRITSDHVDGISADYGWSARPGQVAGRLTIERRDGRIASLAIVVDRPDHDA